MSKIVVASTNPVKMAATQRGFHRMFPADTAKRLVLVSDGNETVGDAAPAARQAAGGELADAARRAGESIGVPVDVLPLAYRAPAW